MIHEPACLAAGLQWLAAIGQVGAAHPALLLPGGRWRSPSHDPQLYGLTGALLTTERYMAARVEGTPAELNAWTAALRDAVLRNAARIFDRRPLAQRTPGPFRIAWQGRSSYVERLIAPRLAIDPDESGLDGDLADLIRSLGLSGPG